MSTGGTGASPDGAAPAARGAAGDLPNGDSVETGPVGDSAGAGTASESAGVTSAGQIPPRNRDSVEVGPDGDSRKVDPNAPSAGVTSGETGGLPYARSVDAGSADQRPGGTVRKVSNLLTSLVVRLFEVALILVGLAFVLVIDDDDELLCLAIWDLLALTYIGVGAIAMRRSRLRPPSTVPQAPRLDRFRFNFAFALVASLIGFTVAVSIATSENPEDYKLLFNILGVIAMVMSWMLLQAGYARRYATIYRAGEGGLEFPSTQHPAPVDFLYFAVTIGTAFSVSDVLVTNARMRWHVMVHSTLAFFYNAAVVAFALSLFAGR